MRKQKRITYSQVGDDYDTKDPIKKLAQLAARQTAILEKSGFKELSDSRGESAFAWSQNGTLFASVVEGLGTKNIVADETRKITGKTYHYEIAQDDVAMIVNDLIVVGARPLVVSAYFAAGSSGWFEDRERMEELTDGFRDACNKAGAVWGGGESPTLRGIIEEGKADLAGAAIGEIKPKTRLTLGDKLTVGDRIIFIESSGIHANGLTLVRDTVGRLPQGYATKLSDGRMYGEALLTPTHIYAKLIQDLFEAGVDIHYMVNVTGHGWRKLMRAERNFSYVIGVLPEVPEELLLIQKVSRNDDREMYGNYNMGAGFAIYIPEKDVETVHKISLQKHQMMSLNAGYVEKGKRQVVIRPKNLVYKSETLDLR